MQRLKGWNALAPGRLLIWDWDACFRNYITPYPTYHLYAEDFRTYRDLGVRQVLSQLPRLKYIGVLATGYNVVDVKAATKRGIVVTNIPAYSTESVAQMTFAHILNITNRIGHYARQSREGRWSSNPDFCYWDTQLWELSGKTIGIVGLGNIGQAVARRILQHISAEVRAVHAAGSLQGQVLLPQVNQQVARLQGCRIAPHTGGTHAAHHNGYCRRFKHSN